MRRLLSALLLMAFSACSGPSATLPGGSQAGGGPTAAKAKARFVVHIPRLGSHRARYISAATKSMAFGISTSTGTPITYLLLSLTPGSPSCPASAGGYTCTVEYALAPCVAGADCYQATIATYDQACTGAPSTCTAIPVSAKELSGGQELPFTVAPGQANDIHLTLAGVPVSVTFASGDAFTLANGGISGFDLVGLGSHAIVPQARDADDDIIVGAGSPSFTVAVSGGTLPGVTAQPSGGSILVTPPASFSNGVAALEVTPTFAGQSANGCALAGANCAAVTTHVDMVQLVVVQTCGSGCSGTADALTFFAAGGTSALATVTAGTAQDGLAADASGTIYAVSQASGVQVYKPPFSSSMTPSQTLAGVGDASVQTDAAGDVFVDQPGASQSKIYKCTHATLSCTAILSPSFAAVNEPAQMAVDAAGDVAIFAGSPCDVNVYKSPGYGTPVSLSQSQNCRALAFDSNGDLFIGTDQQVYEYGSSLSGTPTTIDFSATIFASGTLAVDSLGNLVDGVVSSTTFLPMIYLVERSTLTANAAGTISSPDFTGSCGADPGSPLAVAGTDVAACIANGSSNSFSTPSLATTGSAYDTHLTNVKAAIVLP